MTRTTRTTFNDEDDATSRPLADPHAYLPCCDCRGSTPRAMLTQYGARCRDCFERYCIAFGRSMAAPVRTRAERVEVLQGMRAIGRGPQPGRNWAHRLRECEQRGDALTPAQRVAWRAALGLRPDAALSHDLEGFTR